VGVRGEGKEESKETSNQADYSNLIENQNEVEVDIGSPLESREEGTLRRVSSAFRMHIETKGTKVKFTKMSPDYIDMGANECNIGKALDLIMIINVENIVNGELEIINPSVLERK
jgi:hypothetical protein